MKWKKKISYKNIIGIREYSKYGERLTTIKEYKKLFKNKKILDVGCGKNFNILKNFFGKNFFGLDFEASQKYFSINFDKYKKSKNFISHDINSKKLPLKSNSISNVICTDVLEHVDNPHLLLKELFKVSSEHVIVSLPNNWPPFYWDFILGKEINKKVGYGLFNEPQTKGLRHQFFFNFEHACNFLETNCNKKFYIKNIRFIFEHTSDGMLSSLPILSKIYNILGKINISIIKKKVPLFLKNYFFTKFIYFFCKLILMFIKIPNIFLTAIFYGLGKLRFYNLFCRQIWFVYKKK